LRTEPCSHYVGYDEVLNTLRYTPYEVSCYVNDRLTTGTPSANRRGAPALRLALSTWTQLLPLLGAPQLNAPLCSPCFVRT